MIQIFVSKLSRGKYNMQKHLNKLENVKSRLDKVII